MPRQIVILLGLLSALVLGIPVLAQDGSDKAAIKGAGASPEVWADPGLKIRRELALWLDAGRLNAARKALGKAKVSEGGRKDCATPWKIKRKAFSNASSY